MTSEAISAPGLTLAPSRIAGALLCVSVTLMTSLPAVAGTLKTRPAAGAETVWQTQAVASNPGTVSLLAGLDRMEGELNLGLLLAQSGQSGSAHFTRAHDEIYGALKDGLAKAGATDLEPLFAALVGAADAKAAGIAHIGLANAIDQARAALKPSDADLMLALAEVARGAAGRINAAGPTPGPDYQIAWSEVLVSRSSIDALLASEDPAVRDAAKKMASEFDGLIISMPDVLAPNPIEFDPAAILQAVATVEAAAGSV